MSFCPWIISINKNICNVIMEFYFKFENTYGRVVCSKVALYHMHLHTWWIVETGNRWFYSLFGRVKNSRIGSLIAIIASLCMNSDISFTPDISASTDHYRRGTLYACWLCYSTVGSCMDKLRANAMILTYQCITNSLHLVYRCHSPASG